MKTETDPISRRRFLKASGISLALPVLESLMPRAVRAVAASAPKAQRLVCVGTYLGYYTPAFFPKTAGRAYEMTPLLKPLEAMRGDFTVFSGFDHRAPNGHAHWNNYLTGSGTPGISMDQIVAKQVGAATRLDSLELTCGLSAPSAMSFTKEGVALPMIGRPSVLFEKLFASSENQVRTRYLLASGRSVLDFVNGEAKALERSVSAEDRTKLGEYFAAVRDVEHRLQKQRAWMEKPVAKADYRLPEFDPVAPDLSLECETIMYDLMALALQTDSTRVLSFLVPGSGQVFTIDGAKLSAGYHGLSHHGNDPARIAEFMKVNLAHIGRFARFIERLKKTPDAQGQPLLDSTIVLLGTGMGDANIHDNSNLPVLVAGGGFKHGSHITTDRKQPDAPLLGDLYLTLMQRLGVETNQFAAAKRNLNQVFS
jgi:hypothetical protein